MIDVDTEKLRQCGNDLIRLSQDLSQLSTGLYDRISNMPMITQEWIGNSSFDFASKAMTEKVDAVDLKNQLYVFGAYLIGISDKYEETARGLF